MLENQKKKIFDIRFWIVITIISLFIGSVIGLIILQTFFTLEKDSFGREIGNTLLQIIAVSGIGAILSMLLEKYKQQQEDATRKQEILRVSNENKNQFRKDILSQLDKIYSDTKSARRMLRAKGFDIPYQEAIQDENSSIDLQVYDESLDKINSYQLDLEIIVKGIETNKNIFKEYQKIKESLSAMEKFLGEIVKEYEDNRAKTLGTSPFLINKELKNIKQMIDHTGETSPFRTGFVEPYKNAIGEIRKELLNE